MSLTRTVFVVNLYKEVKIPPHESGATNTKIVNVAMWSVPEISYMQLELLYGDKCRCGIFGGTAYVG